MTTYSNAMEEFKTNVMQTSDRCSFLQQKDLYLLREGQALFTESSRTTRDPSYHVGNFRIKTTAGVIWLNYQVVRGDYLDLGCNPTRG